MPIPSRSHRECRSYEREWNGFCVDKNLKDNWLVRLNSLKCLRPISICEGHFDKKVGSARRYPHIKLRLQDQFLPDIAGHWSQLKPVIADTLPELFHLADTYVELELMFKLRWGRGRFPYRENLTVRIHARQARMTEDMDAATHEWLERTVNHIEELDQAIEAQLCTAD